MADVPASRPEPDAPLPARRLSTHELEAVIRRAVELQAAAGGSDEGVAEAEVMRIGQELGLEPAHVRRALTDIRSSPPEEGGLLARVICPRTVRAGRTIRRPPAELGRLLEEYMVRVECMQVHRRFPDRTRYVRDSSFAAGVERFTRQFGTRVQRLDLKELDIGVAAVDEDTAYVELSLDMGEDRAGFAWMAGVFGTVLSAPLLAFAFATPAPELLALGAAPILGGMTAAMRAAHRHELRKRQDLLESFLDRLEHGEVRMPQESGWAEAAKRLKPPRV
jgi:hypothetical protein